MQGVGFRPFVHRLATEMRLGGQVGNDAQGVFVEVEGLGLEIDVFERRLVDEAPPLARIDRVEVIETAPRRQRRFQIAGTRAGGQVRTFVSPDIAVCADCLAELDDPRDRRYRYPFINCTNCGPRFTITLRLPYDRPNTTMAGFSMCRDCQAEYNDPSNRRFHAQPIACPACGPQLWFARQGERIEGTDPALNAAVRALEADGILAVKGLGGFHLACDATSSAALAELRRRKARPAKAFAVMVKDLGVAALLAHITPREASLLESPQRPIVLLRRRSDSSLTPEVAPDNPLIGLLLPYTPLHHMLLSAVPGPLVMTSGNLADEPICFEDDDARRRLAAIADCWLEHDRPIHVPCDDSVMRVAGDLIVPIRRSRGYAPLPLKLPAHVTPTLAVGAELKNTFCVGAGSDAWVSQHIGDMGSLETLAAFERSVAQFDRIYEVTPERIAADSHPGYQTRAWAERRSADEPVLVQHHHAHVASVMADNGIDAGQSVIGFAFDGTGYGPDGAIWGGEVLLAGYDSFERVAHLRYVPLPGGDASIRNPYRVALAHLRAAGVSWTADLPPVQAAGTDELLVLERQFARGFRCVPSSSMGRLFDAVSSLIGYRHRVSYEAQAAIELEAAAEAQSLAGSGAAGNFNFEVGRGQIDAAPVVRAIASAVKVGVPAGIIAAEFHHAVVAMIARVAAEQSAATGIHVVALTGGVFQNTVLLQGVRAKLEAMGLSVCTHRSVPPNDAGVALGQLIVAGTRP
ncbi:MAG: carbamoyltransferase HypF [Acidimicrobiaceae bacterium]|nr:carbamoyltransferase HypF [Acidimicrobiaceae bacterium]